MKQSVRQMITCHWTARRLQRYLDADPSAPLTLGEISRLEQHLAICERCTDNANSYRLLRRALSRWPGKPLPDAAAVARLRDFAASIDEQASPQ